MAAIDPSVRIARNTFGQLSLKYPCPLCGAKLASKAELAGKEDSCPDCQATFMVPGADNIHAFHRQETQKAKDRQQRQSEERLEKQRAREAKLRKRELLRQEKARLASELELQDTKRSTAVTWCIRVYYKILESMYWSVSISCIVSPVVGFGICFYMIVTTGNVMGGLLIFVLCAGAALLVWVNMIMFIGLVGTLLEIEKNTRAIRLEWEFNADDLSDDEELLDDVEL